MRPVPDVRLCARLFECLREAVSAFKARHCMAVKCSDLPIRDEFTTIVVNVSATRV